MSKPNSQGYDVFHVVGDVYPEVLQKIWEHTKEYLRKEGYPVKTIPMPKMGAYLMPSTEYRRLDLKCRHNPYQKMEYGDKVDYIETAGMLFPPDDDYQEWRIYIDEKWIKFTETILLHEMCHIWENDLKLEYGTLSLWDSYHLV